MPNKNTKLKLTKKSTSEKIKKAAFLGISIKLAGAALSFFMFFFLARSMSATGYGNFSILFSTATLISVIGSFGQRSLSLRHASIFVSENKTENLLKIISSGYVIIILGTLITTIATSGVIYVNQGNLTWMNFQILFIISISISLLEYQSFYLRSSENIALSQIPRDVLWRSSIVIYCGVYIYLIGNELSLEHATYMVALLAIAACIIQLFKQNLFSISSLLLTPKILPNKSIISESLSLWGVSITQIATPNLAPIVLGFYFSEIESGSFFSAMKIAMLLNIFLLASTVIAGPLISKTYNNKDYNETQKICFLITCISSAATTLVFLILVVFGKDFLQMFNEEFSKSYSALLIIAAGYIVNVVCGPTLALMEMTGQSSNAFKLLLISNIISIAMLPLLTTEFGQIGAAICIALSTSLWNFLAVIYCKRELNIDPSLFCVFRLKSKS